MARYEGTGSLAAAANKPFLVLTSDGNVHPEVTFINVGFEGTPADESYVYGLYEVTDAGTGGTAITPKKNGHGATPSCTLKKGTYSADPTKTGISMCSIPCYRRARAPVLRHLGDGFRPETLASNRGLSIWCDAAGGSGTAHGQMEWWE